MLRKHSAFIMLIVRALTLAILIGGIIRLRGFSRRIELEMQSFIYVNMIRIC
jgi:hypothetical protein